MLSISGNALTATRYCVYPVALVAGLALSAAGTGLSMAGDAKSKSAMNDAQNAELLRQKGYQQEADAAFQGNLKKSGRDTADTETEQGATRRMAEFNRVNAAAGTSAPLASERAGGSSAAGAAARTAATTQASNSAWSKLTGDARAKLGGADDWELNQGIRNNRAGQDLGIASSKARGSAAVLPVEMVAAQHKGDALRGWGQLASALGSVAGMYGATTAVSAAGQGGVASAGGVKTLYDAPSAWGMANAATA
jgi:hypothetical protein